MSEMPDFIRRAIEAQGKVDPDEVAALAEDAIPPDDVEQDWRHALPSTTQEPLPGGDVPPVVPEQLPLSDPDRNAPGKAQREGDAAETQRLAALRVMPHTGTARRKVLDLILIYADKGLTDEEIQDILRMNPSTERPRRVELVEGGWIKDSGQRRPTASGMDAVVWVPTEQTQ